MVPIGVAPAGAQVSGSMNMPVRRAPPVTGSGKWPTAVLRRMASSAEVHESCHPGRRVHLALEQVVVGRAGHYLQQPPRDDHPAVGVADVLACPEQGPAGLPEPVEEDLQSIAAPGVREEQVRVDPVGVIQKIPDTDLSGRCGRGQLEFRQVRDDPLVQVNGAALGLLEQRVVVRTFVTDPKRNPVSSRIGAPVTTFAIPWATTAWPPSW